MISEIILMNGYGLYVWSAFSFTLISFLTLFLITNKQLSSEKKRFASKIGLLNTKKLKVAKLQNINKEILDTALKSKI